MKKIFVCAAMILVLIFPVIAANLASASCEIPLDPQSACEDDCLDTYWACWNACGVGAESYVTCKPACTSAYDLCVFNCYLFPCGPDPV